MPDGLNKCTFYSVSMALNNPNKEMVVKTPGNYSPKPTVSCVVVSRGERTKYLDITLDCFKSQDYDNIKEWIFINGSQSREEAEQFERYFVKNIKSTLHNARTADWIGQKFIGAYRNECIKHAEGEIIVCFDDDDYYYPTRVKHTVEMLVKQNGSIAGCDEYYIYDFDMDMMNMIPKTGLSNHVTNNTIAYSAAFARKHRYDESKSHAEEPSFIENEQVIYLLAKHSTVQFSHYTNTYSKRRLMMESILKSEGISPIASTEATTRKIESLIPDKNFIEKMRALSLPHAGTKSPYDIVFYAGFFQPEWKADAQDLGGSEQAIVNISTEWAKMGHKVAVYGLLTEEKTYKGVDYFKADKFLFQVEYKNLILWRLSGCFILPMNFKADRVLIDLHDNHHQHQTFIRKYLDKVDYVMFKSDYHRRCFLEKTATIEDEKQVIIPNGVRISDFTRRDDDPERDPFRFVYCSSYDRGLLWMVYSLWPVIEKMEPRAELHVYYGVESMLNLEHRKLLQDAFARMRIMDHGRQPLDVIRREKQRAGFHLYPTVSEAEIDCISIRESLVAGCIPILTKKGVMLERDGFFIDFDISEQKTMIKPAIEIVKLARDKKKMEDLRKTLSESKTITSWSDTAAEWVKYMK